MAETAADIKEYFNSYVVVVDMPGIPAGHIKVQLEEGNVLVVSAERTREEEEGVKYLKMERRLGKITTMFQLPQNSNTDHISSESKDGVLFVTVRKQLVPLEPKAPKIIPVKATK